MWLLLDRICSSDAILYTLRAEAFACLKKGEILGKAIAFSVFLNKFCWKKTFAKSKIRFFGWGKNLSWTLFKIYFILTSRATILQSKLIDSLPRLRCSWIYLILSAAANNNNNKRKKKLPACRKIVISGIYLFSVENDFFNFEVI